MSKAVHQSGAGNQKRRSFHRIGDCAISSTEIEYFLDQIVYDAKTTIRTIHSRNQHQLPKKWPPVNPDPGVRAAVACSNLLAATTSTLQSREPTPLIRA